MIEAAAMSEENQLLLHSAALHHGYPPRPVVTARPATYVKVANFPGLYRHSRSGRYYACKKLGGIRRERSLGTCDRKIAERRMKEWLDSLDKVDAEVEKITIAGSGFRSPRQTPGQRGGNRRDLPRKTSVGETLVSPELPRR